MQPYKLLSLDESGKAAYTHSSELFILTGVVIPETLKAIVDRKMRKLKHTYFEDEEVVFHGRDMARHGGQFTVLNDETIETKFWSEFISIVNRLEIALYFVVTDKTKAKKAGWQPKTILRRSYVRILSEFAHNLKNSKSCGRIINESETEEDQLLIFAHNRLQVMGTGDGSVSGFEYKKMVTSLSLVNKDNLDIDVQIADTVGFVARLKYQRERSSKDKTTKKATKSEEMRLRLIDRKISDSSNPGLFEILI